MAYATSPTARALACLRVDREYGEGTFDDMERRAFADGPGGGVDGVYDRICTKELERARRDI